jgi:hypothetical protein
MVILTKLVKFIKHMLLDCKPRVEEIGWAGWRRKVFIAIKIIVLVFVMLEIFV